MEDKPLVSEQPPIARRRDNAEVLPKILDTLQALQRSQQELTASVEEMKERVDTLAGVNQELNINDKPRHPLHQIGSRPLRSSPTPNHLELAYSSRPLPADKFSDSDPNKKDPLGAHHIGTATNSKIILTTYPHQSGIDPIMMDWGNSDPAQRGPVVVSRAPSTIRRRNGKPK